MFHETLPASPKISMEALPLDLDNVPEDLRIRAQNELLEDENKVSQCLKQLRSKLGEESNLRWQDDDLFLLAFLRARKFDVHRAFRLMKGFYTNLGRHGDIFYTINFDRMKSLMADNVVTFLPYRDEEGCVIFMYRCGYWNPDNGSALEYMLCTLLGIIEALRIPSTQIAGFQLIADFKNFTMGQFMHVTPTSLKFFADMIQNAFPVRMRGFHLVNQSSIYSYIWKLMKILLSKKLGDRIHLHGSDMKSLHKFFHPSILPSELEGELPPFNNAEWRQKMEASVDYFKHVLSFGYEYNLRKDWRKKSRASSSKLQARRQSY